MFWPCVIFSHQSTYQNSTVIEGLLSATEYNVTVSMDLYVPYNLRNVDMFVENVCRDSKHFWTEGDEFGTNTLYIKSSHASSE